MYIVTKESIVYILYMMSLSFLTRIKKRFVYFKFIYSYHNNLLNATKLFWFGGPWFIDMISKTLGRLIPNEPLGRVESWSLDQPSLIKPCMQFSRTRLSDVLHRKACAFVQPAVVGTL
jgi:hypothetical protein